MKTKYIIEVEDKPFELLSEDGFTSEKLYRVKGFNSLVFDWNGLNMLTPYTEPEPHTEVTADAYQRGYEEGYKDGYNEPGKGKIQVGDEVTPRETEYDDMIVTRLWKDDYDSDCIDAIGFDGRISSFLVSRVSKTGKHYEIAEVLQKMKES